jgi:hypothetical protein
LATTRPTGTLIAPVADLVGSTVDEVAGAVDETVAGPVSQTLTGTGTGTGTGTVAGVLGEVSAGAGAASSLLPADPGGPATVAPSPGTAGRLLPDPVPGALSPVGLPSPRPAMPVLTAPVSPAVARGVARTVAQSCQWADSTGRQSNTTSSTPASPESPVEPWPRPGERPVEVTLTQMVGGGGYPSPVFAIVGGCWLPALTACPGDALAHVNGRGRFILHGRLPG